MKLWVGLMIGVLVVGAFMAMERGRIVDPRLCKECDPPSFSRVSPAPDVSWTDTGRIRCRGQSIQREEGRGSVWGTTRHRWRGASAHGIISQDFIGYDAPGGYSVPESCTPIFSEAARHMMMQMN